MQIRFRYLIRMPHAHNASMIPYPPAIPYSSRHPTRIAFLVWDAIASIWGIAHPLCVCAPRQCSIDYRCWRKLRKMWKTVGMTGKTRRSTLLNSQRLKDSVLQCLRLPNPATTLHGPSCHARRQASPFRPPGMPYPWQAALEEMAALPLTITRCTPIGATDTMVTMDTIVAIDTMDAMDPMTP